ncbi:hypothetical protein [Shewanella algae]|uniref:hypothetical protein n=1 Tax=Shewanella algae TaxID=38313 RepID=UPI0031F50358
MSQSVLKLNKNILNRVREYIPENMSPFSQEESEYQYRFISFICEYCRNRVSLKSMPSSGVTYFVFIPPENIRDVEELGVGVYSLKKNKDHAINGKLFLCLDGSLNRAREITFYGDKSSIWNQLEEKLHEVENICDQSLFHSIVDYNMKTISVYLKESNNEHELIIDYTSEQKRFSREDLNEFSDDFHERETKLPTCGMMIWKNQKKHELTDNAEDRIALRFALTLSTVLGKDYVSQETRGAHGRADVIVHTEAMLEDLGPCILEFKVLRNSNSDVRCNEWLQSGILQVLDYGKDRNAKSHYLMVYDGRKILGRLESIVNESKKKNITYLHFKMYNTVDGERKKKLNK